MTSKSPPCSPPSLRGSVFTTVCEPACVRGGGHDEGLHLVIMSGCVMSATCRSTGSENGVHGVCVSVCVGVRESVRLKDPLPIYVNECAI